RTRAAEVLGPYAFQFRSLPDQTRFQHAGLVLMFGVQAFDPVQNGRSQPVYPSHYAIPATALQHFGDSTPWHGSIPENMPVSQVRRVVESAGIVVIVRRAKASLDFDALSVGQALRLVIFQGQTDARLRARFEFQRELLAI